MFDFSHLPQNATVSEYTLRSLTGANAQMSYVWHKPPNAKLIYMLAIGGGGGGAGGSIGAGSTSGGGGGGSGSISQALFLSHTIPPSLFVNFYQASSSAGVGGPGSGTGTDGLVVRITNYSRPGTALNSARCIFLYASPGGGGSAISAGIGGTASTSSDATLSNSAIYRQSAAGRNGTWLSQDQSPDISIGTSLPILGGAGGGGTQATFPTTYFNGGGFSSEITAIMQSVSGSLQTTGETASSGVRLPFVITGGCGGGSASPVGGRGGSAGGYGAGGGGGGSGANTTGGRGGDGGPAYACIIAW